MAESFLMMWISE